MKKNSKWKPWHFIALGVFAVIIIAIISLTDSADAASEAKKKAEPAYARKVKVESAFNKWDGSNDQLVKLVKDNLNNPASFEHVSTSYIDSGSDTIEVVMKYRATNAFNAIVTDEARANVNIDGTVISLIK